MLAPPRRFRLKRALLVAGAVVFLAHVVLDGVIIYKNATDSPPTVGPTTCVVKLVRS